MVIRSLLACIGLCLTANCSPPATDIAPAETPATTSDIIGVASVIDGDTIEIHGQRIRLSGFDSPERGKRCGQRNVYQQASLFLADQIGTRTVSCSVLSEDRYERVVAVCSISETDLGHIMVQHGWARDWPKYSAGAYSEDEMGARTKGLGVWADDCPEDLWGNRSYTPR